jgi:hypothetical protein
MTRIVVMVGVWFMFGCGGIWLVSVEIGGATGKPQVLRLRPSGFAQDDTFFFGCVQRQLR